MQGETKSVSLMLMGRTAPTIGPKASNPSLIPVLETTANLPGRWRTENHASVHHEDGIRTTQTVGNSLSCAIDLLQGREGIEGNPWIKRLKRYIYIFCMCKTKPQCLEIQTSMINYSEMPGSDYHTSHNSGSFAERGGTVIGMQPVGGASGVAGDMLFVDLGGG